MRHFLHNLLKKSHLSLGTVYNHNLNGGVISCRFKTYVRRFQTYIMKFFHNVRFMREIFHSFMQELDHSFMRELYPRIKYARNISLTRNILCVGIVHA